MPVTLLHGDSDDWIICLLMVLSLYCGDELMWVLIRADLIVAMRSAAFRSS